MGRDDQMTLPSSCTYLATRARASRWRRHATAAATASEFHWTGMTVGDEDAIFGGDFEGAAAAGGVGSGVVAKRRAAARAASCVVAGGRAR